MYPHHAFEFMYQPFVSSNQATRAEFAGFFDTLLEENGYKRSDYDASPEIMDGILPTEILHCVVPANCCSVDFVFGWSEPEGYEELVREYAACTAGAWSPTDIVCDWVDEQWILKFKDESGIVILTLSDLGDLLSEDVELALRTHIETQVDNYSFLVAPLDAESGVLRLHWMETTFVAAYEQRLKSIRMHRQEHHLRVINGMRLRHKKYGVGTVVDYGVLTGLSTVQLEMDDGARKAFELIDKSLCIECE